MIALRDSRLRQKLTLLLLSIGMIPMLVVCSIAYWTLSNQLTTKNREQLASIAVKQEQKVNGLLQGKQEQVLKLANRYDLQSAISEYLRGGASNPDALIQTIRERKTETPDVESIYFANSKNIIVASSASGQRGNTAPSTPTENVGGQSNNIIVQEDPIDNAHKLYISTIMHVNQANVGSLTLVYKTDDIVSTIEDYTGLGATGETIVATKGDNNTVVAVFPTRFKEQSPSDNVTSLNLFSNGNSTYGNVTDYRGHKVTVSAQTAAFTNWVVATKIDDSEAFAPIAQLRNTLLLIVLASSAAIIGMALYITRYFTAPIIALTEKSRKIMSGDFTQRITVGANDEIGTLAATFNSMTDKLAESYSALEQKVTERTQALNQKVHELATAKAKDEAILGSIGEGLVVTDKDGIILLLNEVATQMMELGPGIVAGMSIDAWQVYDENDTTLPIENRPVQQALSTREKVIRDAVVVTPEGSKRTLSVTATPVMQDGAVIGVIQIIRDKTKEKEVDRMKTEFISLASHQLRTPLSAIRWFSEMLMSGDAGDLSADQKDFAKNIYDSTERMIELVSSLLNISRIESGRIIIDPKPTELKVLVGGIVNDLKAKIEERQQNLIISVHEGLPKVNIDPRLIGQVYLNLLTNAIKYTPKGGEISVFISRKGDDIISQVTDNGYGIPKEQQAKMFQKFFRATNIVKKETDGTGLGMYLIKSIVDSSGGKIWFESEEDKGTTFWFSLPASGMKAKAGEVTID
jgi:PAS domain S-box-containing protein